MNWYSSGKQPLDMKTRSRVQAGHPFSHREKARMRRYVIMQLSCFDLLTLTLSRQERELTGQH
jgi:hypothetical protein